MSQIIEHSLKNLDQFGLGCIKNKKHPGYNFKLDWIKNSSKDKISIKQLIQDNKSIAFIEYCDIENCHRAVEGKNYTFIHCVWTYPKKMQNNGYATKLLQSVIDEAKKNKKTGISTITSKGSWIAEKEFFKKIGFKIIDTSDRFELMVLNFNDQEQKDSLPYFSQEKTISSYNHLHLLYTEQCPMNRKFIDDIEGYCKINNIPIQVQKLTTKKEINKTGNIFGIFTLIYKNTIYADHPISLGRFKNIIHKEIKL